MSRRAGRFWDRVSRMSGTATELGPTACKIADATQEYLPEDSVVLDLGCGPGDLTLTIARKVMSILAMDSSPGMIHVATMGARQQGIENVDFVQGSLLDIPAHPEAFTAVTAFNVLHYIEDVPEAVQQVAQQLASGGLFLSSTACLGERRSLLRALTSILTKLGIMPHTHFFKQADLTGLIMRGGFQIVTVRDLSPLPECFIVARKAE